MHWCMDETLALLAMIPFIGYMFRKLHVWWHTKIDHTCHEKHCDATHAEHPYVAPNITPDSEWDGIAQEDVEERFGEDLVFFLYEEAHDAGLLNVTEDEVRWYVNGKSELLASVRGKVFLHDYYCCEYGWREE